MGPSDDDSGSEDEDVDEGEEAEEEVCSRRDSMFHCCPPTAATAIWPDTLNGVCGWESCLRHACSAGLLKANVN
jgi:hypothetical protein